MFSWYRFILLFACHCPDLLKDKNIRDIAKFANQIVENHVKDIKKIIDHHTSKGGGLSSEKLSRPLQLSSISNIMKNA